MRERNEDAVRALHVGSTDVLALADGLGGLPDGADASRIAVRAASEFLRRWLPRTASDGTEAVRALVAQAIWAAARALAVEGLRAGYSESSADGLRSTLVVAVGLPNAVVVGYIGDGGVWLRRREGQTVPLMVPQKADALNVLAASLGPCTQGTPEIFATRREPGDLLVAATDGVADRVNGTFCDAVHDSLVEHRYDPQATVDGVLRALVDVEDAHGHVFDDNVSLGLMWAPAVEAATSERRRP